MRLQIVCTKYKSANELVKYPFAALESLWTDRSVLTANCNLGLRWINSLAKEHLILREEKKKKREKKILVFQNRRIFRNSICFVNTIDIVINL